MLHKHTLIHRCVPCAAFFTYVLLCIILDIACTCLYHPAPTCTILYLSVPACTCQCLPIPVCTLLCLPVCTCLCQPVPVCTCMYRLLSTGDVVQYPAPTLSSVALARYGAASASLLASLPSCTTPRRKRRVVDRRGAPLTPSALLSPRPRLRSPPVSRRRPLREHYGPRPVRGPRLREPTIRRPCSEDRNTDGTGRCAARTETQMERGADRATQAVVAGQRNAETCAHSSKLYTLASTSTPP